VSAPRGARGRAGAGLLLGAGAFALALPSGYGGDGAEPPPRTLAETGLYADPARLTVDPRNRSYSPQYPLWSDGADKSRWVYLPPGRKIDVSDPDAWSFPEGTKFWKEFSFGGRRVETRYLERAGPASWRVGTYLWNEAGTEATLAPREGLRDHVEIRPGIRHDIPSVADCGACHDSRGIEVLGFGALQLSTDRDPLAPHAEPLRPGMLTLETLVNEDRLSPASPSLLDRPPRIAASSPRARAALGYLHGNCAACHNPRNPTAEVGLVFQHRSSAVREDDEPAFASAVGRRSQFPVPGRTDDTLRILPGHPEASAIAYRLRSRRPLSQMPPLGTKLVDREALALIEAWIREDLRPPSAAGVVGASGRR
jgi:mono/diheme cytochrome c family protein